MRRLMRVLFWICIIVIVDHITTACASQSYDNATLILSSTTDTSLIDLDVTDFYTTSTSIDAASTADTIPVDVYWIILMVASGAIGTVLIPIIVVHVIYNFCTKDINSGLLSNILYAINFISYWMTCISYGFLRTNLIVPMGTTIDCRIGFFAGTNSVFLGKLSMFAIFIARIDLAFHSSALGYPRKWLIMIMTIYLIIICGLNGAYVYFTWDLVEFLPLPEVLGFDPNTGLCTVYNNITPQWVAVIGALGLFDVIFSVTVCVLFVYKLNLVIKMSNSGKAHTGASRQQSVRTVSRQPSRDQSTATRTLSDRQQSQRYQMSRHDTNRDDKLTQLMRKQTVLVLLAVVTSAVFLICGAIYAPLSYQSPLDAIVNIVAVWLMFNFADPMWNVCVKYCCCCCYCCLQREDFLQKMGSLSRRMTSLRSRGSSAAPEPLQQQQQRRQEEATRSSNQPLQRITENSTEHTPATPAVDEDDNAGIEIKFDNNWKNKDLADLPKKRLSVESTSVTAAKHCGHPKTLKVRAGTAAGGGDDKQQISAAGYVEMMEVSSTSPNDDNENEVVSKHNQMMLNLAAVSSVTDTADGSQLRDPEIDLAEVQSNSPSPIFSSVQPVALVSIDSDVQLSDVIERQKTESVQDVVFGHVHVRSTHL